MNIKVVLLSGIMANILTLETSTKVCSLALGIDGESVFYEENLQGASHASDLGVFAQKAIRYARTNKVTIDAVAVSSGPGSYTGLRIGVSETKGLCYGLGVPMIAIPSLKVLAQQAITLLRDPDMLYCPMIDARRMEVYAAIYDHNLNSLREVQADIVDETSYQDYLSESRVAFFGDGADKCKAVISSPNELFIDNIYPNALAMLALAEKAYAASDFVDVAYFEPFYLKEFQATVAKNKVIPGIA